MDDIFQEVLALRRRYGLSWAGAEALHFKLADMLTDKDALICQEEDAETMLLKDYDVGNLIDGPEDMNVPLMAFRYFLRRFLMCARCCSVCHRLQTGSTYQATRAFVCKSPSCSTRFYREGVGRCLEYAICTQPTSVDTLVSLAYTASFYEKLSPLPVGLDLRTGPRNTLVDALPEKQVSYMTYDEVPATETSVQICEATLNLLKQIPPIATLKALIDASRLAPETASSRLRVQDLGLPVPEAAWVLMRWVVFSSPMRIEEMRTPMERVRSIGPQWRQFRLTCASQQAEDGFTEAIRDARTRSTNSKVYPSAYGFHGSPVFNWYSILHHGLWLKDIANGRKFGDGVYFSKMWRIAEGFAKTAARAAQWPNRAFDIDQCLALAEVVNERSAFVYDFSTHRWPRKKKPTDVAKHVFVVDKTDWIIWCVCSRKCGIVNAHVLSSRFLMVKGAVADPERGLDDCTAAYGAMGCSGTSHFVKQDPKHVLTADGGAAVLIPEFH
ncbi:uncharacterized protein BXZ73DRAFT_43220 [Epithele typhae]|uniref:uncharacterized protein n=1 Tax=Epithele typhae TaxID=378194 RepID=UPI00200772E1|nr:uncharacterized protein BXZ73DRAFT_43220 [Epithele typhae]KAH9940077.1 hypothetical protein BXZ73DRAFT_43220 [Epithele typhae]